MSSIPIKPQNLQEKLVWYNLIGTYLIYLLGAQYVVTPFMATFLTFNLLKKWWNQTEETPPDEKITISPSAWVWLVAVLIIEVALIVGHLDFDLGISTLIKSSLTWYRGWGIFPLFILVGHLKIRPKLIYRAVCILCFQSLIVVLVASLAAVLKLPQFFYTSPLRALGGVSRSYEVVLFYIFDESQIRLQLFAPWAPALGIVGNIFFCLVLQERDKKWQWIGMVGAMAMIVSSVSRLAIVCLPVVLVSVWLLTNLLRPWVQIAAGFVCMLFGVFSTTLISFLQTFKERFDKARSGSSEVRAAIQRMTKESWWNEAPIWGHGRLEEQGPAILAYLPLGTHHTWFGILYTQGLVGCIALAIALSWSFVDLLIKAQTYEPAKVGLRIILVFLLFSFGETIDSLAYVCWPGLLMLGIAFKQSSDLYSKTNKNLFYS